MPQLKHKHTRRRPMAAIWTTLVLAIALAGTVWFMLKKTPAVSDESLTLIQPAAAKNDATLSNTAAPRIRTLRSTGEPIRSKSNHDADSPPRPSPAKPAAAAPDSLNPTLLRQSANLADEGKLVQARTLLNDLLVGSNLSDADARQLKGQIAPLQQTLILSPKIDPTDPLVDTITVPSGGVLAKLARPFDVPWQGLARINHITDPRRIRVGQKLKAVHGPFHAVVDKSDFTLDLYLGGPGGPGSTYVATYHVGLGSESSTPTGLWRCNTSKVENPKWTNPRTGEVVAADDPQNPLGERWIGLEGIDGEALGQQSYGIHGTIEPDTIGTNASMGCIRLLPQDVEVVYDLLTPGKSTVRIVE